MSRRYMAITACACALVLGGCGRRGEVTEQQMALRSQGMEQALSGDYESAVASYNEALSLADMRAGARAYCPRPRPKCGYVRSFLRK